MRLCGIASAVATVAGGEEGFILSHRATEGLEQSSPESHTS